MQYYNDDLGDAYGNCSTLWQDIARRLFEDVLGIFYCTDVKDELEIEVLEMLKDED